MTAPKLQPPGAGLPLIPRLYVRWFGRRMLRRKSTWDSAPISIEATAARMYGVASTLSDEVLTKPVLVPPMRGLEDSSRYWSPAMVLQHLVITGEIFTSVILKLTRGEPIESRGGTAAVKPSQEANREDVERFRAMHTDVGTRIVAGVGPDRTGAMSRHPWFGLLTASDWYAVFAEHLLIHEKQLAKILELAPRLPM
jgi:hypothetical protein